MTKSYIGAKVRLLRDISTRGGTKFRAGVVMRCRDSTSGGLCLSVYSRGWCHAITGVSKRDVEVVEWPQENDDAN